jgi:predicted phosphodiesterase
MIVGRVRSRLGKRSGDELDESFARRIATGMEGALERADELERDLESLKLVVFSDHHRGARDPVDDFLRCEPAYCAALGHYLESGYELVVLGDVEELWKNSPRRVVDAYRDTLRLEAEFHARGRYHRVWGNHDDDWSRSGAVKRLQKAFDTPLEVSEAIKLTVRRPDGGPAPLLFLVHGHQGTKTSDRFAPLSRLVVRVGWRRLQRGIGLAGTTPAQDFDLRARHDRAMFEWARGRAPQLVLVAGHTHRPVFWTSKPPPPRVREPREIRAELEEARKREDPAVVTRLRAELEFAEAELREERTAFTLSPPSYFNTGCCSFGDGDITGIEIAEGEFRLVKWPREAPEREILAHEKVTDVLDAVAAAEPGAGEAREERVTS